MIVGLNGFGLSGFDNYSTAIKKVNYLELSNAVYDEIHIREKTQNIDTSNNKEDWQLDTALLALFKGDLEAGNINNFGVKIEKFAIKRRKVGELKTYTLGYRDFENDAKFTFEDYTQPSDEYIYTIVPVGENGLEGQGTYVQIDCEFTGWVLVDKDTNEALTFDKYIGSAPNVDMSLNDGRVQLETLYPYPTIFHTPTNYHSFSITGVFVPEEWKTSRDLYQEIMNKFVHPRKPMIAKSGNGEIYVVEIGTPSKSIPMNTWKGHDYLTLTLNLTEIMPYDEFIPYE